MDSDLTWNLTEDDVFAVYSLPEQDHYTLVVQQKQNLNPIQYGKKGFVVAPFIEDKDHSPFHIISDKEIQNADFSFSTRKKVFSRDISKNQYIINVEKLKTQLLHVPGSKVILSRTKSIEIANTSWADVFLDIVKKLPNAFVFMVNTPQYGTWIGASPELLFSQEQGNCQTIALAGTQRGQKNTKTVLRTEWSAKDQKEHSIVAEFIKERLSTLSIQYTSQGPYTVRAANLIHLRTDFQFGYTASPKHVIELIHPSPALLGWPEENAKVLISKFEENSRGYYCGFLGPTGPESTMLYVNLRSMLCTANKAILYAGSGILSESVAEKEWEETELKMRTMQSFLTDLSTSN